MMHSSVCTIKDFLNVLCKDKTRLHMAAPAGSNCSSKVNGCSGRQKTSQV
jgi:hypothetical protein